MLREKIYWTYFIQLAHSNVQLASVEILFCCSSLQHNDNITETLYILFLGQIRRGKILDKPNSTVFIKGFTNKCLNTTMQYP